MILKGAMPAPITSHLLNISLCDTNITCIAKIWAQHAILVKARCKIDEISLVPAMSMIVFAFCSFMIDINYIFSRHWIAVFSHILPRSLKENVSNLALHFRPSAGKLYL